MPSPTQLFYLPFNTRRRLPGYRKIICQHAPTLVIETSHPFCTSSSILQASDTCQNPVESTQTLVVITPPSFYTFLSVPPTSARCVPRHNASRSRLAGPLAPSGPPPIVFRNPAARPLTRSTFRNRPRVFLISHKILSRGILVQQYL